MSNNNNNKSNHYQRKQQCIYGLQCNKQPKCWFKHTISSRQPKSQLNVQNQHQSNVHSSQLSNSSQVSQENKSNISKKSKKNQNSLLNKNIQPKSDIKSNKMCRYRDNCFSKNCIFRHPNKEGFKLQQNVQEDINADNFQLDDLSYVQPQISNMEPQKNKQTNLYPQFENYQNYQMPSHFQNQNYQNKMLAQSITHSQKYPQYTNYQIPVNSFDYNRQSIGFLEYNQQNQIRNNPNYIPYQFDQTQNQNNVFYQNPMMMMGYYNPYICQNQYNDCSQNVYNQYSKGKNQRSKIFKEKQQESESDSDLSGDSDAEQYIKKNKEKTQINNPKLKNKSVPKLKNLFNKIVQNLFHKTTPEDIAINYLHQFFNNYKISPDHQQTICGLIQQKNLSSDKIYKLVQILILLTNQRFKQFYGYVTMSKIIIRKKFNVDMIIKKLNQGKNPIIKKRNKQQELYKNFPKPKPVQFLEMNELLQLNLKKTIFLIDGNNVLVTNNVFRKYFQSKDQYQKIQAQIRLNWLVAYTLRGTLFYDDNFLEQIRKCLQTQIMTEQQEKQIFDEQNNFIQVIYAKQKDQKTTADQKILQKLISVNQSLLKVPQQNRPQVVLVSADRILTQQCLQIMQIKKTSGRQFIKFCKKALKNKFYHDSSKKGIIKKIFTYRY